MFGLLSRFRFADVRQTDIIQFIQAMITLLQPRDKLRFRQPLIIPALAFREFHVNRQSSIVRAGATVTFSDTLDFR